MCYICPINHPFAPKGVQLSLVRLTKAFFGWIPSNCWIFHHSSSFLMTLGPSLSAFVSFLSYHWLFNVATSFVNGPLSFVWNIDTVRWSGVWRNHLIYVLDSDYIFVGKVPGHVIYCILLQHAACVSLLRVSMPSLSFLTLPRDPPPHFRNTCLCCLISVIIIHFSVSSRQQGQKFELW